MEVALAGYDFPDNKACLVCCHVMDREPVLGFFHDEEGDLHFSCGREGHEDEDWKVVDIEDVMSIHPDICGLPTVRMGEAAERIAVGAEWIVEPTELQ